MEHQSLREIFYNHEGNQIHKWDHYFEVYEKYFSGYIGQRVNMLEIGVNQGGSLQLWKKYFGNQVHVYTIDINPECKRLQEENTTVFIGSQSDTNFLSQVLNQVPDLDIIIDDGGHTMKQQIVSFEALYAKVKEGGVYIVEDTHTSYWEEFGGGLGNRKSFIEYCKKLIDSLYTHHLITKGNVSDDHRTQHINGISFYDSIVVFEKKKRPVPFHTKRGNETVIPYDPLGSQRQSIIRKILNFGKSMRNTSTFAKNSK
jgi:hypothetical protein